MLPFDVPGMRAMVGSVMFYAGGNPPPALKDRQYKTEFAPTTIWAELILAIDVNAKERRNGAAFATNVFRDGTSVYQNNPFTVNNIPREWSSVYQSIWLGDLVPGAYRVEVTHAGKIIGSGTFVVKQR